jgi:pimeloyl-ACP methyl ester carboxylesterase
MIKRGYVDVGSGQVHYRRAAPPAGTPSKGTVVLFHETPVSSAEYESVMRELARDRVAIALDTPGFGMSDPISNGPVGIADYAKVLGTVLDRLADRDRPVAVFGFHTGAAVALEIALQRPDRVDVLMLGGVPFRSPEERAERLAKLPRDKPPGAALEARLKEYWDLGARGHPPEVPPERALDLFEQMVLGGDTYWWAYDAVWRYPIEERLARVQQPTLMLAPHEMLHDQTLAAARLVSNVRVVEFPDLKSWVLETGAEPIARAMREFLDAQAAKGSGTR